MKLTMNPAPRILLPLAARTQILTAAAFVDGEFTFLAAVTRQGNEYQIAEEVIIPPQYTDPAVSVLSPEALQGLPEETLGSIRLYGHSHGRMDTFFSQVDETQIAEFSYLPWFLALVVNRAGRMLWRLVLGEYGIHIADPSVYIQYPEDSALIASTRSLCARNVTERPRPLLPSSIEEERLLWGPRFFGWDSPLPERGKRR